MVLGGADVEGGTDQDAAFIACAFRNEFRADGVRTQETIGAVLLGGTNGYDDAGRLLQVFLDFRPGRLMKLHFDP